MNEDSVNNIVNVLGAVADYLVFQMAFQYHMTNPDTSFEDALQYTFDRLGETQNFIPKWVAQRNAQLESVE